MTDDGGCVPDGPGRRHWPLDSGLRRNDGGMANCPAGMTDDGGVCRMGLVADTGRWIPACAGMTGVWQTALPE